MARDVRVRSKTQAALRKRLASWTGPGAAQAGDLAKLRRILSRSPASVHGDGANGGTGYTPLHYASRAGKLEAASLLLEHGAEVDSLTKAGGATPLHRAAAMGHTELARLLVTAGANGLRQDSDGENPLHKAAANGHVETCRMLLDRFPESAQQLDKNGKMPCERSASQAVSGVLERGRDPDEEIQSDM